MQVHYPISCPPGTVAISPYNEVIKWKLPNLPSSSKDTSFGYCFGSLSFHSDCDDGDALHCWSLQFLDNPVAERSFLVTLQGGDILSDTVEGTGPAVDAYIAREGMGQNGSQEFAFPTVISQTCIGDDLWSLELPEFRYPTLPD